MHTTRISLIQRLAGGEEKAWNELDEIYRPLVTKWLTANKLAKEDVDDLVQELMLVLHRELPRFEHNGRTGAFRKWLRQTTSNLSRNHLRKRKSRGAGVPEVQEMLTQLADSSSAVAQAFDREHDQYVIRMLLRNAHSVFEPITMQVFQVHVIDGIPAAETAKSLNVSVATVHTAKSRVLRRLRQEAALLIDEELVF